MKSRLLSYCLLTFLASNIGYGQLAVIDPAQINQRAQVSASAHLQRTEMIGYQVEQLRQLAIQVDQMRTQLKRIGDPATPIQDPPAASAVMASISSTEATQPLQTSDEIYPPVSPNIQVLGEPTESRDPSRYLPEQAAQAAFARYHETRAEIVERRSAIRKAIQESYQKLQTAQTTSEIQKRQGLLLGLQSELIAIGQELDTATQQAVLRVLENDNQRTLNAKAAQENDQHLTRRSLETMLTTFRLPEAKSSQQ